MMVTKYLLLALTAIYSINYVNGCSCMQSHPQNLFCQADFVMLVRLRGKPEDIFRKEEQKIFDKDTNSILSHIDRTRLAVRYNVKIRRVFKANNNSIGFNKNSTVTQLYTPPDDGLCGVYLAERTNYLVSGTYSNGKLQIQLCSSLHMPWNWVSKMQRKGLNFTYGKSCDCQVVNTQFDSVKVPKSSCKWDPTSKYGDCYGRATVCIHDKNSSTGGCKWKRNNQLRQCRAALRSGRHEP